MRNAAARVLLVGAPVLLTACLSWSSPSIIGVSEIKAAQSEPLSGFNARITFVDVLSDGSSLLVGGENGVALYDTSTLDERWKLSLQGLLHGTSNNSNGTDIALVEDFTDFGLVIFVNPNSGEIRYGVDLNMGRYDPTSAAFSPQGDLLAIGFWGGPVMVWDIEEQKRVHLWLDHVERRQEGAQNTMVSWSSDGKFLAAGGWYTDILIWDVEAGELLHQLINEFVVSNIALSPDDKYIAVNSTYNEVAIWQVATEQLLTSWQIEEPGDEAPGGPIMGLAWSPDGAYLAAATVDGAVTTWATSGFSLVAELVDLEAPPRGRAVHSIRWSADGSKLYTGSYAIRVLVWDWRAGQVLGKLRPEDLP